MVTEESTVRGGQASPSPSHAGLEPPATAAGEDAWELALQWTDHILDTVMSDESRAVG